MKDERVAHQEGLWVQIPDATRSGSPPWTATITPGFSESLCRVSDWCQFTGKRGQIGLPDLNVVPWIPFARNSKRQETVLIWMHFGPPGI